MLNYDLDDHLEFHRHLLAHCAQANAPALYPRQIAPLSETRHVNHIMDKEEPRPLTPHGDFNARRYYRLTLFFTCSVLVIAGAVPILNSFQVAPPTTSAQTGLALAPIVSAIIAAIALTIASAVFLPELRIRHITEQQAEKTQSWLDNKLETQRTLLQQEVGALRSEQHRLDAHLSRVLGVVLVREDPFWALGWLLRSARRYALLPNAIRRKYSDLLIMIAGNIDNCAAAMRGGISTGDGADAVKQTLLTKINEGTPFFSASTTESGSEQRRRVVVRLLKDFFDLSLFYREKIREQKDAWVLEDIVRKATPVAFVLVLVLRTQSQSREQLRRELSDISSKSEWHKGDADLYGTLVELAMDRVERQPIRAVADFLHENQNLKGIGVDYLPENNPPA